MFHSTDHTVTHLLTQISSLSLGGLFSADSSSSVAVNEPLFLSFTPGRTEWMSPAAQEEQ